MIYFTTLTFTDTFNIAVVFSPSFKYSTAGKNCLSKLSSCYIYCPQQNISIMPIDLITNDVTMCACEMLGFGHNKRRINKQENI